MKANRGAAGVDGQTIEQFEEDLYNNLYKLWNRMAAGSYMPKAVRRVEMPKPDGGTRPLGIPTVADRIAQTPMATGRANRRTRRWNAPGGAAGTMRGSSISISRGSSTPSIMGC